MFTRDSLKELRAPTLYGSHQIASKYFRDCVKMLTFCYRKIDKGDEIFGTYFLS